MARTTASIKHTHKYFFLPTTGLWYCSGYDGCTHFMPKNMPIPAGRMSLCWRCDRPFMMVQYHMEDSHPKCDRCMEHLDKIGDMIDLPPVKHSQTIEDEVEVHEPTITGHDADCDVYIGGICTCQ